MPNHKTRSTFYFGSKHSLLMKFDQLIGHIEKEKILLKYSTKTATWKLVLVLLCLERIKHNPYWKMKFLKQTTYVRDVLVRLSKFAQTSTYTSSDLILQRIP